VFNIPKTISKYLTYTLIIHIIALGFAVFATIFGALSHIKVRSGGSVAQVTLGARRRADRLVCHTICAV
jgi:hypothetical protein